MTEELHPYTCARCGREIGIHEFVQLNRLFLLLGKRHILHFCRTCFMILKEEVKNERNN